MLSIVVPGFVVGATPEDARARGKIYLDDDGPPESSLVVWFI